MALAQRCQAVSVRAQPHGRRPCGLASCYIRDKLFRVHSVNTYTHRSRGQSRQQLSPNIHLPFILRQYGKWCLQWRY